VFRRGIAARLARNGAASGLERRNPFEMNHGYARFIGAVFAPLLEVPLDLQEISCDFPVLF
jgi:hypothetical protein